MYSYCINSAPMQHLLISYSRRFPVFKSLVIDHKVIILVLFTVLLPILFKLVLIGPENLLNMTFFLKQNVRAL